MEFRGTVAAGFSASHVVRGHPRCGRIHGHRWQVEVSIRAGQDPVTGELIGLPELATAVEQLCAEVDREDVNAMFPASPPTPAGIARAFHERLILQFRTIVRVRVSADNISATLE